MSVRLRVSLQRSALTAPILDGEVLLFDGAEVSEADTIDANTRGMLGGDYDVAEMSIATFVAARAHDDAPLMGLPVFTGRRFPQRLAFTSIPGIGPCDLAGLRVAFPQYWMSSSVWHRGILADRCDLDLRSVTWLTTTDERGPAPRLPAGVRRANGSPMALLAAGQADAVFLPKRPTHLPPHVRPLYSEPVEEARRYFEEAGVFPIMHLVVVRSELAADPGVVRDLVTGFVAAFRRAPLPEPLPGCPDAAGPWEYGLDANSATLGAFFRHVRDQGLVEASDPPEHYFAGV